MVQAGAGKVWSCVTDSGTMGCSSERRTKKQQQK
jgi:hypothetical protein